jgi:arabinosyltransferase A
VTDVTAPLVSGAPQDLDISIPCQAIATLPAAGGLVVSTIPPAGIDASRNGLFVRATADVVVVAVRDSVAAVAPRAAVAAGACSTLHMWANPGDVGADFIGIPGAAGTLSADKKPQVAGVFTDLKVAAQSGLSARIDIDTRFITSPTPLKLAVMVLGVVCVLASIVALAVLDRRAGHRVPRAWRRFWRVGGATWLADVAVIATLLLWHLIGALSSDDGYNLSIARVSGEAGYTANYYRFFGATEAPFDWYQSVLAHLATISTASVWMRIPATLAGIATWLILSRCVLPRLGRTLAAGRVAVWTAGAVFLAAWLPFNNGLRPEPLIAFGTVAAWVLVENAIGTRRLTPYAVAIVVAMFSVTLAPQGLIAIAPLLVGARAAARMIRSRRAVDGIVAPLATLLSSIALVFVIVFRDQTLATVAESARIKYVVGPTIAWYQEFLRYYFLTVEDSVDSSLTRRFAVLVLLLCLFGMLAILLRRSAVPGMARGPVWRLIGSTAIGLLLLTFTPTKWAVQFGAFAGLAGALGAVTAFAVARVGLHSRRNLALYVTALLFALAWATSGINGWFYVGNYGVPWFDKQPVIFGFPVLTIFLVLAMATGALAGWLHFRMDYAGHTEVANTGRNRVLASTPLLVVATIMVVLEVGSLAKGAAQRYPVYTTAEANVAALAGFASGTSADSCSMADDVLVEPNTNAGLLQPVPGQKFGQYGPLGGEDPVGFTPNGVSDTLEPAEPVTANPGLVNSDGSPNEPNVGIGYAAGTGGGYGPVGVNGSNAFLPFGLDPKRTPVMGSYNENTVAAKLTSAWYQLPPRTPDRPLVTIAAAGAIWYYEEDGSFNYGQSLKLEWGVHRPDGSYQALGQVQPIDIFTQKAWRNLRFPLTWAPPEANVARIVADDPNLSNDQWFAFTPPRMPVMETAQQLLGSQTPVLMDIATAANFPCQRPFSERLGVAELPEYRIQPNFKQMVSSSNMWQSAQDGGPFLFIQALLRTTAVPSYLRDDWYRDWGSIERYDPVVPSSEAPNAAIEQGTVRVFGWSRNGPIRALP